MIDVWPLCEEYSQFCQRSPWIPPNKSSLLCERMERAERAHTGSVGASVQDAARAHHGGARAIEREGSRTRGHPPVRRPAAALRPEAHEELRRLLLMDAASLSAQLPELSPRLDGYRVMRELIGVAMSGEAEAARARFLVRAHGGSAAWQAHRFIGSWV